MFITQTWTLHVTVTQVAVAYGLLVQTLSGPLLKHGVQVETVAEAVVVWQVSQEAQVPTEEKLEKLHQEVHLPFVQDRQVAVVQ